MWKSDLADEEKKRKIRKLLDQGWKKVDGLGEIPYFAVLIRN